MLRLIRLLFLVLFFGAFAQAAEPLRIFIRAGVKTHGPGQHDHPQFLEDWTKLLKERGATVDGGMDWPSAEQWAKTDVVIVFARDPWDVTPEQRAEIDRFAARGGSFVALHDGICGKNDSAWAKSLLGGAWTYGKAKYFEGDLSIYYVDPESPIVAGASNFDVHDEMYYELDMEQDVRVLAATWTPDARAQQNGRAFPHIYNEAPQMWTYEHGKSRAFVDLLGHNYTTLQLPHVRAILLRGIAWAGHRENLDELCKTEEIGSLRYPEGGPTAPADAAKKLTLHPEFSATLVAAEPLINKPIAIDWDPQGRIWIAETVEYPNGRRGMKEEFAGAEWKDHGGLVPKTGVQNRPARDRISRLIDKDGDGIAETKEVFYEGLELVTGFVFYRDGVIASAAPDILWLRDTDGDGKADKVEKLYTGLGTNDTHAVINNLRWGADGWIYATHGYSGSDKVTNGAGDKNFGRISSGVVRFKPDGSAIEQFSSKGGNTWGLTITTDNEIFWTQPTSGDLLMQTLLPESTLSRGRTDGTNSFQVILRSPKSFPQMTWTQQAYRQIDYVGSFTAAAGCAIYDGGAWPAKFQRSYFCTEPTINIVHNELLEPAGTSFAAHKEPTREETEFIRSSDLWFRPIETRIGPDGSLYVLDFYNQAVIHNDTRGPVHNKVNAAVRPDRDHYFGRIWRIDHKDSQRLPVPNLTGATTPDLIAALGSANRPLRFTAERLLTETSDKQAEGPLRKLVLNPNAPATARVQALWTLHVRGSLDDATIDSIFKNAGSKLAGDPANAVLIGVMRALAEEPAAAGRHASQVLAATLANKDAPVRLAALRALGEVELSRDTAVALAALLPSLADRFEQSAVLAIASRKPGEFLATALAYEPAVGAPRVSMPLLNALAAMFQTQPEQVARFLTELAGMEKVHRGDGIAILTRLSSEARVANRPQWRPELASALRVFLKRSDLEAAAVLPFIVAWDADGALKEEARPLIPRFLAQLSAPDQREDSQANLAVSLIAARSLNPQILPAITALLITPNTSPVLQNRIVEALGDTADPTIAPVLIAGYAKFPPPQQALVFSQLLKRAEWTRVLIDEIGGGKVPLETLGVISIDKLRHHADPVLAKLATETIDKIRGPQMQKKDEIIAGLLPVVQDGGDAAHGKVLFATCAACHRFNGEGANLAPDLTGMGAHPRAELLTHIVDPNREVDPSFSAYSFQMKNGDLFQGIISSESKKSLRLRDVAGEKSILKDDIVTRTEVGRSLMPEGFEALGAEGLRDIIAYLQSAESRFRIVDLQAAYTADSRRGLFQSEENLRDTLQFKKFGTVRVGDVPFFIADPAAVTTGRNLIVLRGGGGFARSYPQKVEIVCGKIDADAINILGGIGGWAFPCCGDEKNEGLVVAKITVVLVGGGTEVFTLKNGVEIADFVRPHDVPGSKLAEDVVNGQQVRVIRKALTKPGQIEKIVVESFDNRVAPVFVAITTEKAETPKPAVSAR